MGVPVIYLQLSWSLALSKSVEMTYYVVLSLYFAIHLLFFFYFMHDFSETISFLFISIVDYSSVLILLYVLAPLLQTSYGACGDILWYSLCTCISTTLKVRLFVYFFIFLQYIHFFSKKYSFSFSI